MKYSTVTVLAVSLLGSGSALAGTHVAKLSTQSHVASAPLSAVVVLTNRVANAVAGYVDAMSARDVNSLAKVFTEDAMVEFVADTSQASVTVHADSLLDDAAPSAADSRPHVANVHVYPTKDVNVAFVQYDVVADSADHAGDTSSRLALIEMRGEKIEKMTNFNGAEASLARSSACVTPGNVVVTKR